MDRREFIHTAVAATSAVVVAPSLLAAHRPDLIRRLKDAKPRATSALGDLLPEHDAMGSATWNGDLCSPTITNRTDRPLRIREVILADVELRLPPDTQFYGESFQMLSQTAGTLGAPQDLGYSELKHYRLPQPQGATAISGMMVLSPPRAEHMLVGFASCRRFNGRFFIKDGRLQVIVDSENLELNPGETWRLEDWLAIQDPQINALTTRLAGELRRNHPTKLFPKVPTGWCSWYCFGPRVTSQQVLDNLDVIAKQIPELKYVQIDDGYQPAMGDWLETGAAFGGNVQSVLKAIRERGFEPAIWVAPFIAESKSHLFQQHPDWFVKDDGGNPLPSDRVTFGGWRRPPWYALDGTHPEVQQHFENLFRTMRQEWGCTYFKLDANFWGAMHGGHFHDATATRIEAYRRGMEAVRRGAGDAFILGCNHPIWPSLGLIDGSRASGDIKRTWAKFAQEARQTLLRNWQNGSLWWNDADAVLLTGDLTEDEYQFHATAAYASGGMVLSGDDLTKISPARLTMLRKLVPPTGKAAVFTDSSLEVGVVRHSNKTMYCLFNWMNTPRSLSFTLRDRVRLTDYWSGKALGVHRGRFLVTDMPAHSARLIEAI